MTAKYIIHTWMDSVLNYNTDIRIADIIDTNRNEFIALGASDMDIINMERQFRTKFQYWRKWGLNKIPDHEDTDCAMTSKAKALLKELIQSDVYKIPSNGFYTKEVDGKMVLVSKRRGEVCEPLAVETYIKGDFGPNLLTASMVFSQLEDLKKRQDVHMWIYIKFTGNVVDDPKAASTRAY